MIHPRAPVAAATFYWDAWQRFGANSLDCVRDLIDATDPMRAAEIQIFYANRQLHEAMALASRAFEGFGAFNLGSVGEGGAKAERKAHE